MERDSFKSRLGFILVSAGCAIGIGNVWKFPYVAGENGGGIFVVLYLLFLVLKGQQMALARCFVRDGMLSFDDVLFNGIGLDVRLLFQIRHR